MAENQRQRLFGAMVASVAERGYAGTRVTDLTTISGVSSKAFYRLFEDKEACFLATLNALLGVPLPVTTTPEGDWKHRAQTGAMKFAEAVVRQPAAAKLLMVDGHGAGPTALQRLDDQAADFERRLERSIREAPGGEAFPPEMLVAVIGAFHEVTRSRLRRGRVAELPHVVAELVDTLLSYRPPTEPLHLSSRAPTPAPESLEAPDPADRLFRALAVVIEEEGYAHATVGKIVKRAGTSNSVFYAHFRNKEEATLAAIDSAGAQIAAAMLPAFRRGREWALGVRAALGAFFNFLAARPAMGHLMMVETFAVGPAAIERREETLRHLIGLLGEAPGGRAAAQPELFEAIAGAIFYLAYRQLRGSGSSGLPALAPICTYIALAPFLGPEAATEIANGDGGVQTSRPLTSAVAGDPVTGEGVDLADRERISPRVQQLIAGDFEASRESGFFDRRPERVLARAAIELDVQAWRELSTQHAALAQKALALQEESLERLRKGGGERINVRHVSAMFEMPF